MNLRIHLKLVGGLYIAFGLIGFASVFLLMVPLLLRDVSRAAQLAGETALPLVAVMGTVTGAVLACSAFNLWFGSALRQQKRWATRVVGFIWGFLNLLSFPLGTAVGGYTLWVLFQLDKQETLSYRQPLAQENHKTPGDTARRT